MNRLSKDVAFRTYRDALENYRKLAKEPDHPSSIRLPSCTSSALVRSTRTREGGEISWQGEGGMKAKEMSLLCR